MKEKREGSGGTAHGTAKSDSWGYFLAFISGFLYSITTLIVKQIKNIHSMQLVVYRYFAVLSFSLPQLFFSHENFQHLSGGRLCFLILVISSAACTFFEFAASRYLPVGEAATLISSFPAFVAIAGRIFLNESFGLLQVISLLTSLVGLVFVTGLYQTFAANSRIYTLEDIYGLTAGLASVCVECVFIVLTRKMRNIHSSVILFGTALVGVILAVVVTLLLDTFRLHYHGLQQGLIILLGISGYLALMAIIIAEQYAEAGPVSMIKAASFVLFSFLWQIVIFHDDPEGLTILGAVFVGISVLLPGLNNRVKKYLPDKCLNFC